MDSSTADSSPTSPLFDPADFRIPEGVSHVCAAGETPFLRRHDHAIAQYIEDKSLGPRGRVLQEGMVERARMQMARLWAVDAGDIGWVSNVAEGISLVLDSIDWREGDEVSVMPNEYPSLVAPLMARPPAALATDPTYPVSSMSTTYRVRFADTADLDALIRSVNPRTRVVLLSHVSYLNGERYDLASIRAAADAVGAMLIVDFTQAAGYLPINAADADFAFSASYKWMLGTTGVATAYWNRARRGRWAPASAGWYSLADDATDLQRGISLRADALRFTRGNPAHLSLYILSSALDYLSSFDAAAIQRHVQTLTSDLLERLGRHRIASSTPAEPARHGASVCLARGDARQLQGLLQDQGILAWNGRGRLRISFHGYNDRQDVDRVEAGLLDALPQLR